MISPIDPARIPDIIYPIEREIDMTYRAHIEGFTNHFATVEALKAWALGLLASHPDLRGKEVQIWKATWVGRESATYNATPSKVCVLGA